MAKDQLLALAVDTDRLLGAGAAAASGSEKLRKHAQALRDLGQKVAAVKPVADAVAKVLDAPGKQAGPAFLNLVVMSRQIRASLAGAGVEGELQPLPPSGPWATPLSVRDIQPLREALTQSGEGREKTLQEAVERNAFRDLRLLPELLNGLDSGYAPIADLVAEQALPALGPAVLPEILAGLKLQGKTADARRLGIVCKLDRAKGAELCRQALQEGSAPLRVKALECLPDVGGPGEAEKVGLELIRDKNADVRAAAASALRAAVSDEALDCLLAATQDKIARVQHNALGALAETPHARALARVLAVVEQNLKELNAKPVKGAKKGTADREQVVKHTSWLLNVIGQRKDAGVPAAGQVVLPLVDHKEADLRDAAVRALGGIGAALPEVLPRLIKLLKDPKKGNVHLAVAALARMSPADRAPAIPAVLEVLDQPKVESALWRDGLMLLPPHVASHGKKILALMRDALDSKDLWVKNVACEMLGAMGPAARAALPDLLEQVALGTYNWCNFGRAFVLIDPEGKDVLPGLIDLLSSRKRDARWKALHCLDAYGPRAKAALPELRRLLEDEKEEHIKAWTVRVMEAVEGN
jgi:HEAT repeat protein